MNAERWMQLHPEVDIKAYVEKIKNLLKDDLYQIILWGPSTREDRGEKYTDSNITIILNNEEIDIHDNDLLREIFEFGEEYVFWPYLKYKRDFEALIPFSDTFNECAVDGIIFYGPEINNCPTEKFVTARSTDDHVKWHYESDQNESAYYAGLTLGFLHDGLDLSLYELIIKWLSSHTVEKLYQPDGYHLLRFNGDGDYIYTDWLEETSLKVTKDEVHSSVSSPIFWLGFTLQYLMYRENLHPAEIIDKYDIKRIIDDLEKLYHLFVFDGIRKLNAEYKL